MARHNWTVIEEFYIAGKFDQVTGENLDWSYQDICKVFKIGSHMTVKRHVDKRNWRAKRAKYKEKLAKTLREKMQKIDMPELIDIRKRMLKAALGTLTAYLAQLEAGTVDVKPGDALKYMDFLIEQYHIIFGIPTEPPIQKRDVVLVKGETFNDLFSAAASILHGPTDESNGS